MFLEGPFAIRNQFQDTSMVRALHWSMHCVFLHWNPTNHPKKAKQNYVTGRHDCPVENLRGHIQMFKEGSSDSKSMDHTTWPTILGGSQSKKETAQRPFGFVWLGRFVAMVGGSPMVHAI